ncbi:MAG: endonuclease/exonuclease/phosphatase family protein [Patescibacteria group bacterium]
MKIISLNVGIKIDNSKQVGEFIQSQNPDIVAFQEIIRNLDESVYDIYRSKEHIEKIIGKELPYSFFGPLFVARDFTKDGKIHRDFGGYIEQGNEVISKFPINEATNEFYYKAYSYDKDRTNFATEDNSRALQVVDLDIAGQKLIIINVHGTYSKDKQDSERSLAQSKYVIKVALRKKLPTIIVGDFNLFPETNSIKIINRKFRNLVVENKIKTTRPKFDDGLDKGENVVDYIFVNDQIKVNKFELIDTNISDHLPIILDFDIIKK